MPKKRGGGRVKIWLNDYERFLDLQYIFDAKNASSNFTDLCDRVSINFVLLVPFSVFYHFFRDTLKKKKGNENREDSDMLFFHSVDGLVMVASILEKI